MTTSLGLLVDKARGLRLGDGRKKGTDVGPLIHEASREKVEAYVDIGQAEGADLLCGGRRPDERALANGFFFEPTIFARVEPGSRLEQEEIFGPVLSVIRVSTPDEAFAVNNDVKYGLSSSVYTRDVNVAYPGACGARQWDHVRQCAHDRSRGTPPIRGGKANGQRAPRGWLGGLRVLLGDEGRVHRFFGIVATGTDRQLRGKSDVVDHGRVAGCCELRGSDRLRSSDTAN